MTLLFTEDELALVYARENVFSSAGPSSNTRRFRFNGSLLIWRRESSLHACLCATPVS
jgi:hypothetical protein